MTKKKDSQLIEVELNLGTDRFADILDMCEHVAIIKPMAIKIYHPEANTEGDRQKSKMRDRKARKKRVLLDIKSKKLESIESRFDSATEENYEELLAEYEALEDEVDALTEETRNFSVNNLALLTKTEPEDLTKVFASYLQQRGIEYNVSTLIIDIYSRALQCIRQYNEARKKTIERIYDEAIKDL